MDLLDEFRLRLIALAVPAGPALAAVSGGLDSVVLLDLLSRALPAPQPLIVAHCDHGIHPDSAKVAAKVAAFSASLGLRCEVGRLGLGAGTSETTARAARYAWLDGLRERVGAMVVFTAHHADDQVETILMRALRGSGPAGLAGMQAVNGVVVRPLLGVHRSALAGHARVRNLPVWVDPANSDSTHLRSWLRCEILPRVRRRLPDADARLLSLGAQALRDRDAWDQVLDALPGLDPRAESGGISLAAATLAALEPALAARVLIAAARRAGLVLGPRRAERVLRLAGGLTSGRRIELGGAWRAERAFDRLALIATASIEPAESLAIEGASGHARWGDWRVSWQPEAAPDRQERAGATAWFTPGELVLRPWKPGDRVSPLAGVGRRPVVRCLQEARVPRASRPGWPVVAAVEAVVWVPGVCRSDALLPLAGTASIRVDVEPG